MKTIIPLLLLALSACGEDFCETPDFEAAGLKICTDGNSVDPEEIEFIAKTVEQKAREVYPKVSSNTAADYKRNDIKIQFIDSDLSVECEKLSGGVYECEQNISGSVRKNFFNIYEVYIRYRKCLAFTSLDHELLHIIEYFYLDGPQGENSHSRPYMFKLDAKRQGILIKNTIEWNIFNTTFPLTQSCQ